MWQSIFAVAFALVSNSALANPTPVVAKNIKQYTSASTDLHTHYLSKSKSELNLRPGQKRTIDFPTQIVRLKVDFSNYNIGCEDVMDTMNRLLLEKLDCRDFTYTAGGGCWASVDGGNPDMFIFSAYFDPQTDEAITYLQQYIAKYNGTDFYGVPFKIESAKGVVVSLDAYTGIEEDSESSIFKVLFHINSKIYFNNLYDIDDTLSQDIENKMITNDPLLITSFIKQWMGSGDAIEEISEYLKNLADSNKVIIAPEFIFLMDTEPKAYTPRVHTTYEHDCKVYPSKRCLG